MTHTPFSDDDLLDRALAAERFYAFPPELAARILHDAWAPGWSLKERALGLAGAVLLAVGSVAARTGGLPEAPRGLPTEWVAAPVTLPAGDLAAAAPLLPVHLPAALAPWLVAASVALLAGGLLLARRWGRRLGHAGTGGVA